MLAGLPPIMGLYAALIPPLVYSLLGTSRQLAVGPVALDSLLVAAGVSAIAESGTDSYATAAVTLAMMVGAIQLLMGVLKLGFLVNFLSRPVISGFTSAAAILIALSQVKYLMGVEWPSSAEFIFLSAPGCRSCQRGAVGHASSGRFVDRASPGLEALGSEDPRSSCRAHAWRVVAIPLSQYFPIKIVGEVPRGLPSPAFLRAER